MPARILALLTACALTTSACSLITLRRPPQDHRPYREPKCAGPAAPALDTVASLSALAGAVVFSVLADTSDFCEMGEPCHHITPGSAFGLAVGFSALSLAFGLSACTGYAWSAECGVVKRDHRKWGEAMYPALQVARVDALRSAKARRCRELLKNWRKEISTAGLQLRECGRFMREYRRERTMLAGTRLHLAVEREDIGRLKQLLSGHPNKNVKDRRGWTALHWAAQRGNLQALEVLLAAGSSPDARDKHDATPLHLAAFAGRVKVVERLAAAADVNARTKSGATPLHAAVLGAHIQAARVLLEHGASADAEDNFGRTPGFYARIVQEPELEKLLVSAAARSTPAAGKKPDEPPPPVILEVGFDITAPFSQSSVCIHPRGKLVYTATVFPPAVSEPSTESETIQLTDAQLEDLRTLISGSGLFEKGDEWNRPGEDCIGYAVSVRTKEGRQSFRCRCGCPAEMTPIRDMIYKLLGHPMMIMGL